jgi:fumarate hydratase class II
MDGRGPEDRNGHWGPQTQAALDALGEVSGQRFPIEVIHALALIKAENARLRGHEQIALAADEVAAGQHDDAFPLDVLQTGSGTSSNMNVNEVVASLAGGVHPNDDVNAPLSSNDQVPSAVHIAVLRQLLQGLVPAWTRLEEVLQRRASEWDDVVKAGRTHLMDALPITLGAETRGWGRQVQLGIDRVRDVVPRLGELALGGTAVGTGATAPAGFGGALVARIAVRTGLPLTEAIDHLEAQGARDALVEASSTLKVLAVSLNKIADDLRWMSSGPHAGLAELALPALHAGSSIMPGKVNPTVPEVCCQIAAIVVGDDATVSFAGASGRFQMNVMVPVIARAVLEEVRLLTRAAELLAISLEGAVPDVDRMRRQAESSPAVITPLAEVVGYDAAAAIVKRAAAEGSTLRNAAIASGVTGDVFDAHVDVTALARGNL